MSDFKSIMGPFEREPDYIGDGVYVSFDGFQIWLRTPRGDEWHAIALDPSTFKALVRYEARVNAPAPMTPEETVAETFDRR